MSQTPVSNGNPKPAVVCVFCAASPGTNPAHLASAKALAHALHASGTSLVYGGGTSGLMGEVARTLVSLSGPQSVHGVIPRALIRTVPEHGHQANQTNSAAQTDEARPEVKGAERGMSESELKQNGSGEKLPQESEYGLTTIVPDMHTRKRTMAQMVIEGGPGSGFVALAGGYGTIEEVMEMVTWNQLGIHQMPIVLLNVDGYWDGLLTWVRRAVVEGLVKKENQGILVEVKDTAEVVEALEKYRIAEGRYELDWNQG